MIDRLLTKREVKMAGYLPRSLYVSMGRRKKERGQYLSTFDRTTLVNKGFVLWPTQRTIYLISPARGVSHII